MLRATTTFDHWRLLDKNQQGKAAIPLDGESKVLARHSDGCCIRGKHVGFQVFKAELLFGRINAKTGCRFILFSGSVE